MFILQNISYSHLNKEILFHHIFFSVQKGDKIALVGQNGVGKSTLLKLISGQISPTEGQIITSGFMYFSCNGSEIFIILMWVSVLKSKFLLV